MHFDGKAMTKFGLSRECYDSFVSYRDDFDNIMDDRHYTDILYGEVTTFGGINGHHEARLNYFKTKGTVIGYVGYHDP